MMLHMKVISTTSHSKPTKRLQKILKYCRGENNGEKNKLKKKREAQDYFGLLIARLSALLFFVNSL